MAGQFEVSARPKQPPIEAPDFDLENVTLGFAFDLVCAPVEVLLRFEFNQG